MSCDTFKALSHPTRRTFANIETLPAEMHGEVALRTPTVDLINLSRTSILLYRSFAGAHTHRLWRVRLNEIQGLPPCPEHLSEYSYLCLVLLSDCQTCRKAFRGTLDWDFRKRLCAVCWEESIIPFDESQPPAFLPGFPLVKLRDFIHVRSPTPHGTAFLQPDLVATQAMLIKTPPDERLEFLDRRRDAMTKARAHARDCRAWETNFYQEVRARRVSSIRQRLLSAGWGDVLQVLGPLLKTHSIVREPVEITKHVWKAIRPELEVWLEQVRRKEAARKSEALRLKAQARMGNPKATSAKKPCPRCPASSKRLFTDDGLTAHTRDKHTTS
ncbi:hypothetical protein K438DRAFT_2022850 [Mycena galopus ATCC 62051]|nr:hypothetical protein K438DRAFT_2022850 [Mycena galopus ATCC 62051]